MSGLQQTVIVNYFNLNFFRIIPISRPVILSELLLKVKTAYGQELSMNYVSNEVNLVIHTCMLFFRPKHSGPITTK